MSLAKTAEPINRSTWRYVWAQWTMC